MDFIQLQEISTRLISAVQIHFKRYLFNDIDWTNPLVEIYGNRGVGKTTIMLQRAKLVEAELPGKVLYASLDLPFFYQNSLFQLADSFFKSGGKVLFLDEVHKYPPKHSGADWSVELKNIYDALPGLQVVYSGSSVLQLYKGKGDLSRRKAGYHLAGLSYREYLGYRGIANFPAISQQELLTNHTQIASTVQSEIRPLEHFSQYLRTGYYPFYKGDEAMFQAQLLETLNLVLEVDIPHIADISSDSIEKLKKLLGAISTSVPYVPNLTKLAAMVKITDLRTLLKYFALLEIAEIIALLNTFAKGNKTLQKPDKIYFANTNLIYAMQFGQVEIGTIRETFMFNQLRVKENVWYPKQGDFALDNGITIEVGGKNKTDQQVKELNETAYLAIDNIEIGNGQRIPLWLFGFLY